MNGFKSRTSIATAALLTLLAGGSAAAVGLSGPTTQAPPASAASAMSDDGSRMPMRTGPVAYRFGETLATLSGKPLEATFMAEIISHHRMAMEMATLERRRGADPDIRTHAENIITSQRAQVRQFTRFLETWYGLTPEQAMRQAPDEAKREMRKLEEEASMMLEELRAVPAGAGFDVEFVRRMIPHHSAGIIEFLEIQARAPHAQLRAVASSGIIEQQSEIADFRTWLSEQ